MELSRIYSTLTDSGAQGRDRGLFLAPLYFVRAGYVADDALVSSGNNGRCWSSTVLSGTNAMNLDFYSTRVYPQNGSYRYYGWPLRCVAKNYSK